MAIVLTGAVALAAALSGCAAYYPPHMRPLSAKTRTLLADKGMTVEQPILIRIFKEEAELEIWKKREDGHFYRFKTYPICKFSGELGPKLKQGDRQAPEGFYFVSKKQMNPKSHYHLSFNLGYPNAYDRSLRRTGSNLMVHGDCKSRGCYAMTDAVIEEIYALVAEALAAGQEKFQVHAFPFRMTTANLAEHKDSKWFDFWVNLKDGYDYFQATRLEPPLAACGKRYVINGEFPGGASPNPARACPRYKKGQVVAYRPKKYRRPADASSLAKPLASVLNLQLGEMEPMSEVMTLGPAMPYLAEKSKKHASKGSKAKVAQRAN